MTSRNRFASVSLVLLTLATAAAGDGSPHVSVVRGGPNSIPPGYVPPLVSNGSLCLLVVVGQVLAAGSTHRRVVAGGVRT